MCVCDHLKGSHRDFTSSKSIQMGFVKTHLSCPLQVLTEPNHGKNDVNRTKYLNHTMNLKKKEKIQTFFILKMVHFNCTKYVWFRAFHPLNEKNICTQKTEYQIHFVFSSRHFQNIGRLMVPSIL